MKEELATRYEPSTFEQRIYAAWEEGGYFTPVVDRDRPKFSIVIPPPNVTGRLHIGHALVNTLQDIIARWKRMSGFNTLWLPGTDHAGIATQMVVERKLAEQGISRFELGREKFVEKIWEWKEQHSTEIKDQLTRLGASCDWTRERFTLDEGLSRAVRYVFVKLYEDGLIYRGIAMVNWCPRCRTAISDIEVEFRERNGKLYHVDYPVEGTDRKFTVATTRPETMLGDTAVAVHPDDERYKDLIGKYAILPVANRRIPIIGDAILVDPTFGTGVVKVTPSHDKNDYETGKRHDLPQLQVIGEDGRMTDAAGAEFAGLDRFDARKKIVEMLREQGFLVKVEDHLHNIGVHGKCDTDIEPMVSRQWFVKIEPLAQPAIEAVRSGAVQIVPQAWEATYYNWMENIHDWTISRQLWWGHRIPAFHCPNGHTSVSMEDLAHCPECGAAVAQETDVLDTWFSSGLWPFSTLGWQGAGHDKTPELDVFYPTDTLITGFDILFFWVARMIMFGLRFTGKAPFSQVFLNGLVRDEKGDKMSKSKGNVIDPLDVVNEVGADALRFTLAIATSGRDIPLGKSRIAGYSAFVNKIWNASRFALMHIDVELKNAGPIDRDNLRTVERWILSRINSATAEVNKQLSLFRFDEASGALYKFFWHEFCDWYIEMAKPVLLGRHGSDKDRALAKRVLLEIVDRSLRLLHPFMPFVTEEIWQKLGGVEPSIMIAPYPISEEVLDDPEAERLMNAVKAIITTVRNVRAERGFTPKDRFKLYIRVSEPRDANFFRDNAYVLIELARLTEVSVEGQEPEGAHHDIVEGFPIAIEFPEKQVSQEQLDRVRREIEKSVKELESLDVKLANEQFVRNAPPQIVAGAQARQAELRARLEKLQQNQ
ncbi:MAG TPA: valine--tRNA ligase [Thermoanaerobaculia bacterium]|jgi:valyl-tRNA synthetase|nr:valine--tRNA ligase [Thermoanaerobaculia bacterium]